MSPPIENRLDAGTPVQRIELVRRWFDAPVTLSLEQVRNQLAHETDERVLATLISFLSRFGDRQDLKAIRSFLRHPDERVCANSVEALVALGGDPTVAQLLPLLIRVENRIKANLMVALYRVYPPQVMGFVGRMLRSDKVEIRASGLFCLRHVRQDDQAEVLMHVVEFEAEPRILDGAADLIGIFPEDPALLGPLSQALSRRTQSHAGLERSIRNRDRFASITPESPVAPPRTDPGSRKSGRLPLPSIEVTHSGRLAVPPPSFDSLKRRWESPPGSRSRGIVLGLSLFLALSFIGFAMISGGEPESDVGDSSLTALESNPFGEHPGQSRVGAPVADVSVIITNIARDRSVATTRLLTTSEDCLLVLDPALMKGLSPGQTVFLESVRQIIRRSGARYITAKEVRVLE